MREIRELQLQSYIFSAIDFNLLQNDILSIVAKLTLQDKYFRKEENAIIISGLALWTSTILKNPTLFSEFLSWKSDGFTAAQFIRNGIYSNKALAVRIAYKMSLEKLSKNVIQADGITLLNFILSVLVENFPEQGDDEVKSKMTKDCNEFF